MNYIKISRKIDSCLYSIYNCFASISDIFTMPFRKSLKKNLVFKNKHKGERCFILGLGPSLTKDKLLLLKNEKTFAVNSFYKFDDKIEFNPKYYFMLDSKFVNELFYEVEIANRQYPNTDFFYHYRMKKSKRLKGKPENSKAHFLYSKLIQNNKKIVVNYRRNTTASMNVINAAIQMAIYMGFKDIYLLGCDFNYITEGGVQRHCYSEAKDSQQPVNDISIADLYRYSSEVLRHHQALNYYAHKKGVKIYNATQGSFIDAYEFINFEKVISK